jgi:hypothetical protein
MPKGPKGQKRPADVIKNAVLVMRIATGDADESAPAKGVAGGKRGGRARAKALTPTERRDIAKVAAQARWKKD